MKSIKKIIILLVLLSFIFVLESCNSKNSKPGPIDPYDPEVAMDNFVAKVLDANYVIEGEDFKTDVYSPDLITVTYNRNNWYDYAFMSVDNEVFQARIVDDELKNLTFVDYNNAYAACAEQMFTLNYITNISSGNMFNLFTNDPDEDFKFVSRSEGVKSFIMKVGGYPQSIAGSMQEIVLTFDSMDINEAHIKTKFYNAVSFIDIDVDLKISFGEAKGLESALEWLDEPIYPTAQTDWNENQVGALEFLFNLYSTEDATVAFPFIDGVSYGLYFDNYSATYSNYAHIIDRHASEEVADNYKEYLVNSCGFISTTDEDGDPCYLKLLRRSTECYSRIYIESTNGIEVVAEKYYNFEKFDNLTDINTLLEGNGFLSLDNTFESINATSTINEEIEAYLHQNEYDLVMIVDIEFDDTNTAVSYLEAYLGACENSGFEAKEGDIGGTYYSGAFGDKRLWFNRDGSIVSFKFKANKVYTKNQVESIISDAGFEAISLDDEAILHYTAKDSRDHQLIQKNKTYITYFVVSIDFATTDAIDNYLNSYVESLISLGYTGEKIGSKAEYEKDVHYINIEVIQNKVVMIFSELSQA